MDGYRLIDVGDGARLERFGEHVIDRPYGGAVDRKRVPARWSEADLHFDRDRGWTVDGAGHVPSSWPVVVDGLDLELRPTAAGQVGLFPEHIGMLPWLGARVAARADHGTVVNVLHLFAYTGVATLALARAGASVAHVDASRPTVAWARRNAARNGLHDRPIRWLIDDAPAFVAREARRGRRYGGLVLDPPAYGHGAPGRAWAIERDLEGLLGSAATILEPDAFVLLTAHSEGYEPERLRVVLGQALQRPWSAIETGNLDLPSDAAGRITFGAFARCAGVA